MNLGRNEREEDIKVMYFSPQSLSLSQFVPIFTGPTGKIPFDGLSIWDFREVLFMMFLLEDFLGRCSS